MPPVIADENDIEGENIDLSGLKPNREDDPPFKTNIPIQPDTSKPIQPEIRPVTPRYPEVVRPFQPIQPEMPKPIRPETPRQPEKPKPIEPDISSSSQPEQPNYQPQQREVRVFEPKPTDQHIILQQEHRELESEPSPTPPQVVLVDVGKETATIDGKKMDDGSVVVDTHDIPKNEWTKLNGKPSVSCPPGFEADNNGVCLGT